MILNSGKSIRSSILYVCAALIAITTLTPNANAGGVICQGQSVVNILEPQGNGVIHTFDVVNSIAYVSVWTSGLEIYDVSNPEAPFFLGTNTDFPYFYSLRIKDSALYATTSALPSSVDVFDISDPTNPTHSSTLHLTGGAATDMAISGTHLYVLGASSIRIYDISNPLSPIERDMRSVPGTGDLQSIIANDEIACVLEENGGVTFLNLSDPLNPAKVFSYDVTIGGYTDFYTFKILDSKLYYTYSMVARDPASAFFDLSDTMHPSLISETQQSYPLSSWISGEDENKFYYASSREVGIMDLSNPAPSRILGTLPFAYGVGTSGNHGNNLIKSGSVFYTVSGPLGLVAIDMDRVQQTTSPQETLYASAGSSYHVAHHGTTAYILSDQGLELIDLSNPQNPAQLSTFPIQNNIHTKLAVDGNHVLIAGAANDDLAILDVSNPSSPQLVGQFDAELFSSALSGDVRVRGTTAYVLFSESQSSQSALYALDITDPATPSVIDFIELPFRTGFLELNGSEAYITSRTHGLAVVDISNPAALAHIVTLAGDGGFYNQIAIEDSIAYIGTGVGTRMIDISDPTQPTVIGNLGGDPNQSDERALKILDGYAYVTTDYSLDIYDIANPASTKWVASHATGPGNGLDIMGSNALVPYQTDPLNSERNLAIIDLSDCPHCAADLNNDTELDFLDISAFLAAYSAAQPLADLNNDGQYDFLDISAFLGSYSAGCP